MISLRFTVCLWTNCGVHVPTSLYLGRPPGKSLACLLPPNLRQWAAESPGKQYSNLFQTTIYQIRTVETQEPEGVREISQSLVHGAVSGFAMALDVCSEFFQFGLGLR